MRLDAATACQRATIHLSRVTQEFLNSQLAADAADALGEDPRGAVKQWRMRAQLSADRAALLLTGDVGGAVRRALGGGQPAEIAAREPARVAEIVRGKPEAFEILRFAASEDFLALRDVMGFFG